MAKVKIDFKDAKNDLKRFKLKSRGRSVRVLEKEIAGSILRGVSPVKGFGRFPKYSDSYRKQIIKDRELRKRPSPVNLKLTGELLKSLFVKVTPKGLLIGFDNFLADIHNREGAGKKKVVRRMLPTKQGEQFNKVITTRLKQVLDKVAREIFGSQ